MCSIEEAWAGQNFDGHHVSSQGDIHNAYMSIPDNVLNRDNQLTIKRTNEGQLKNLPRGVNSKYSREPRVPKITRNTNNANINISSEMPEMKNYGGLENSFGGVDKKFNGCLKNRLIYFRTLFLETQHLARSEKHISNPIQKSSAKRLCMYLRWMVRQDKKGVDFGIWKSISSQDLCLPLDVHTGNVSRILGLLKRKQNDWQAVEEITDILKSFDAKDPIKYDFALFGLGIDGALKKSSKLKL